MTVCSKCTKQIKSCDLKTCSKCSTAYHYQCLGVPTENFTKESKTYKAAWKCAECKLADKRGDSSNTPTPSQPKALTQSIDSPAVHSDDWKQYFDRKLEESLARLLKDIRREFTVENTDTRTKIQELTESVNYMSTKYEQLKEALENKTKAISDLQEENSSLRSQVGSLRSEVGNLSTQLNEFEQHSRDCNLEIQCVPEHTSENLKTVVRQLATTVGYSLTEHELLNYHRVSKLNKDSGRPRSIVVKLSSPLARDSFIAAAKTFNRTHQSDKLNSSHLGIADKEKKPIFVCEHLTPANKHLHAAARKVAKDKKFDFVWVRNGRIFMRKDVNSKSFVVKDLDFLNSL